MSEYTARIEIDLTAETTDEVMAKAQIVANDISRAVGKPVRVGLITDADGEDIN
ncbi:hypothetical protein [Gordonia sihwensis]|uniref:hypothetical protein n=1 Tax=Gordonia sihwensis TaxID=173559 RepID=UPI003D980A57